MSIKETAHAFHKIIWNSSNREEVKSVVSKLSPTALGLGSKIFPTPMLGLLLYNQQAVKRYLGKSAVELLSSWSERDLKILFGVHSQVRRFNEECLAPLVSQLPEAVKDLNPYKAYSQMVSTGGFEELLFTNEHAEDIIQSFHSHSGFGIALSTLSSVKERPLDYEQTIQQLNMEIVEAGPGGKPEWVNNYEEAERWNHPDIDLFRHVGALLSIYNSLANLNQFIFQGLFQSDLIQMNRNQVLDYVWTTAGPGPSVWLMHIPFGYMYLLDPTDLIMVNFDRSEQKHKEGDILCVIHTQIMPLSETEPGILTMRVIDEQLNTYSYLIPK